MRIRDKMYCEKCSRRSQCRDSAWSWVFLFVGIIAAVAMRLVVVFINVNPVYAKATWYVGVVFFLIFFIYRYNIGRHRARTIEDNDLAAKIKEGVSLKDADRIVIGEILCSLTSKKETINFAVIFLLSGISLVFAIAVDLLKLYG